MTSDEDVDAEAQEGGGGEPERDPEDDAEGVAARSAPPAASPRISTTISARPIVPAKIGV